MIHVDEQIGIRLVALVRRRAGEFGVGLRRALVLGRPDIRPQRLLAVGQPPLQRLPLFSVERHRRLSFSRFPRNDACGARLSRRCTAGRHASPAVSGSAPGRTMGRTHSTQHKPNAHACVDRRQRPHRAPENRGRT
ncbi:hypothetical protein LL999_20115 [Burkholderia ambifaria]|uniref:hypothetical protein n=1 Tax=Burkholderia ambifaria TaxID=152480 RepID=UPI001E2DA950|nr:hypothetical protein [Burkholderia ambifaria]UEP25396.1 hypothetical protein LL999_20115 [Burkholderia ambifaria]